MLIAVPAIASALVVSTLSVSLFVTERRDHSPYSLPLPSSIGDFPPESYVFAYGLTVSGLLIVLVSVALWLVGANAKRPISMLSTKRTVALHVATGAVGVFGSLAGFSLGIVASVPLHVFLGPHLMLLAFFYIVATGAVVALAAASVLEQAPFWLSLLRAIVATGEVIAVALAGFLFNAIDKEASGGVQYVVIALLLVALLTTTYELRSARLTVSVSGMPSPHGSHGYQPSDTAPSVVIEATGSKSNFSITDDDDDEL